MTKTLPVPPTPAPLEAFAKHFDWLLVKRNQRAAFRRYLEGLLLAAERNKTVTALANTEPIVGAQHPHAQRLQWFLSESTWDAQAVNAHRRALLRAHPSTAPTDAGALVIDESGDRKAGTRTAHVERQYLANLGKIDNGVVSVSSLWADEHVYDPVEVEPSTPAHYFARGKTDPQCRTKPQIAVPFVQQAVALGLSFRVVVADCFYGQHDAFKQGLRAAGGGSVLALQPSHAWCIRWTSPARYGKSPRRRGGAVRRRRAPGSRWSDASGMGIWKIGGPSKLSRGLMVQRASSGRWWQRRTQPRSQT